MKPALPFNARKIGLIWPIEEGGFGVTGSTDSAGDPIIGLFPLNRNGQPAGQESQYAYRHLIIRNVVGYDGNHRLIFVGLNIELTPFGMYVRVVLTAPLFGRGLDTDFEIKWGSKPPELYQAPANGNWPLDPVAREV